MGPEVAGRSADGQASAFLPVAFSVIAPDSVAAVLADTYRWGPHVEAQLLWHGVNDIPRHLQLR